MKRLMLFIMMFASSTLLAHAQTGDTTLYITNCPEVLYFCGDNNVTISIYPEPNCPGHEWHVNGQNLGYQSPLVIYCQCYNTFHIIYDEGCEIETKGLFIQSRESNVPTPFVHTEWMRQGEPEPLEAVGIDSTEWPFDYTYLWSTGETTRTIMPVDTIDYYTCDISEICGTTTRIWNVLRNVEITSASVDPSTNKNLVTWKVTPEQAEYISNVIINRDGVDMATVPYTDGQYLDNIGSDLAARIYTITGVCPDGTLCPIPSYQRGTIHMAFLPDINGNVEMTWNQPELNGANIHVNRFEICEYDPNSNEINVIDFVSSVTTSYSCNQSMFDYGYPLIRAVIQDGRGDKDMLSNRTDELVGLNETATGSLRVYPNPAHGVLFVETQNVASLPIQTYRITNLTGQTLITGAVETCHGASLQRINIENLPQGMYFISIGDMTRKFVVE